MRCYLRILFIIVGLFAAGCGATSTNLRIQVNDAETGQPIPNATVDIIQVDQSLLGSAVSNSLIGSVNTDESGTAQLTTAAPVHKLNVSASAPSYLPELEFNHEMRGPTATIPLFRAPRATVWVVIPDGYRGPVAIETRRKGTIAYPAHAREFVIDFIPPQPTRIDWVGPLLTTSVSNIRARYSSGGVIAQGDSDTPMTTQGNRM